MGRFSVRPVRFGRRPGAEEEGAEGLPTPARVKLAARRAAGIAEAAETLALLPGPGESLHALMTARLDMTDVLNALLDKLGRCQTAKIAQERKPGPEQSSSSSFHRFIGLDLGQVSDPSALALVEQRSRNKGDKKLREYVCPYLRRWPLNTGYPQIVRDVKEFVISLGEPLPYLVVDITGCGRPVFDQMREANIPLSGLAGVNITGGFSTTRNFAIANVPKRALVSAVRSVLEGRRLRIAKQLREAQTLRRELSTFSVKTSTAGNETYEALRSRDHDDLVLAVALALWRGENAIDYRIITL